MSKPWKKYFTAGLDQLKPSADNPRINGEAVKATMESIRKCGYISPIIVDDDLNVLAGYTRLEALRELEHTEAEVLQIRGLSEKAKREFRNLDNRILDFFRLDLEKLADEVAGLDFDEDVFHISELVDAFSDEGDGVPDEEPAAPTQLNLRFGKITAPMTDEEYKVLQDLYGEYSGGAGNTQGFVTWLLGRMA